MTSMPARQLRRHPPRAANPAAEELGKGPAIYKNDEIDTPDQPLVAHYFLGGADWWVTVSSSCSCEVGF